jgi:hypothetical protein
VDADKIVDHARDAIHTKSPEDVARLLEMAHQQARIASLQEKMRRVTEAFAAVGEAAAKVADAITQSVRHFVYRDEAYDLMIARRVYGGMGTDAERYPDEWLSMACAGLLCSLMPCPSDERDLQCHCRCHD